MKKLNDIELFRVNGGKTYYESKIWCKCGRVFSSGLWDLKGTARIAVANEYSGHILWAGKHGITKTRDYVYK